MKFCFVLCLILFSITLHSAILKHEVSNAQNESFPFKEVCQKLGAKNLELIEAKSLSEIDCMGKAYPAIDFCLNQFPLDKTITRALVDSKTKTVKCEKSVSVMISLSCDKRDLKYCLNPQKGCEELRKIYANRLELVHYSMLEKNVNCYFAKSFGDSINEMD